MSAQLAHPSAPVALHLGTDVPRALFLGPGGEIASDAMICSGLLSLELDGTPCPWSDAGRMPEPRPLADTDPGYTIDKGEVGDLCPPCAKQQLAHLGHWQGYGGQHFPAELHDLRLFKCRMWFWLVVPGLQHAAPTVLSVRTGAPSSTPSRDGDQLDSIAVPADGPDQVLGCCPARPGAADEQSEDLRS